MKTKVKVTINGMDFTLVGEKSEEHLQKVAEVVNTKVEELNGPENGLSTVAATITLLFDRELPEFFALTREISAMGAGRSDARAVYTRTVLQRS